jgi:hypothetical protein
VRDGGEAEEERFDHVVPDGEDRSKEFIGTRLYPIPGGPHLVDVLHRQVIFLSTRPDQRRERRDEGEGLTKQDFLMRSSNQTSPSISFKAKIFSSGGSSLP